MSAKRSSYAISVKSHGADLWDMELMTAKEGLMGYLLFCTVDLKNGSGTDYQNAYAYLAKI